MDRHHIGSSILLAAGVVLVFAGLSAALGVSLPGIIASTSAIAALLYAGAVWFGEAPRADRSVLLFTRALSVASGPLKGRPISDLFPDAMRGEIESRCRAALAGLDSRFSRGSGTGHVTFSATSVRDDAGAVAYGLLLSGSLLDATAQDGVKRAEDLSVA
jgi:hypothetical protein